MGHYSYKDVIYRKDFIEAIPEWIEDYNNTYTSEEPCEYENDNGDAWRVCTFLLNKKDNEIERLKVKANET